MTVRRKDQGVVGEGEPVTSRNMLREGYGREGKGQDDEEGIVRKGTGMKGREGEEGERVMGLGRTEGGVRKKGRKEESRREIGRAHV